MPDALHGGRFLTLNSVIRLNQIEASHTRNVGNPESGLHRPENMRAFRAAVEKVFTEGRMTWAFSWGALNSTAPDYRELRELAICYQREYGDEVTYSAGGYFPNVYSDRETVSRELHDGLQKVRKLIGGGYNPGSVIAGFLSAGNQKYLAEKENIHVVQGNIFSQFAIDNGDGDGAPCYPYYPSQEHFCKPAQGRAGGAGEAGEGDFVDCVNLDGWTVDFLAARRHGFADGFNSRMGVGPIETYSAHGIENGLREVLHSQTIHFDDGVQRNGFGWVTVCWELSLLAEPSHKRECGAGTLEKWLGATRRRWGDVRLLTQGEFGKLWRKEHRDNSFDYRFVEKGSGIGGSDADREIRWFMNREFRLALLSDLNTRETEVIDFTRYTLPTVEPDCAGVRNWSLLGDINQKQTRPQDKPRPFARLPREWQEIILARYPELGRQSGHFK
ncbi:MAG: DUF3863 domain-containing protein [Opitutaceae bacterium]|nr:DUF3863 domain-containing protein [Opitutaceae bacterium]